MSDNEKQILIREHKSSGDAKILNKIQNMNTRIGLSGADAEYFMEFLKLQDDFLNSSCSYGVALKKLNDLNSRLQYDICSNTMRHHFNGSQFMGYNGEEDEEGNIIDGWVASTC